MPAFEGLGKALRWLRAKQDRRQYQVAETAGITKAMLSAYETGKQKPSLETLEKILDALTVDLSDLHEAMDIVTDGGPGRRAHGAGRRAPWAAERAVYGRLVPPPVDVYRALGIDHVLPPEEERAFGEMLSGFHRLMRFLHHTFEAGGSATGAGEPPSASSDDD